MLYLLVFFHLLHVLAPLPAFAEKLTYEQEESQIPKKPSAPVPLYQISPGNVPHCERYYLYQGKKMECDSNLGNDGEHLRPYMKDVPQALAELDTYQDNLKKLKMAAYLGSAGMLIMVAGILISHPPIDDTSGALKTGGWVMLGGFGLAANSLIYGFSLMKTNEAHLGNAVNYYNSAHPDRPIELQFSARVNF